jgi:type IV pilus assembly protein PilZ
VERREHSRAPIELQVDYKKLNSFFADYTKNISKGGTFIKTRKPLPAGTRFLFRLVVPGRPAPFELSGVVAHVVEAGEATAEAGAGAPAEAVAKGAADAAPGGPAEEPGTAGRAGAGEGGDDDEPGMGIRFVWTDDGTRREFEAAVEGLMDSSLGPDLARKLLRGGR